MSEAIRTMSFRLPEKQAAALTTVARAEEVTVSEVLRALVSRYLAECREDQGFKARLQRRLEEHRETLEHLGE